MSFEFIKFPYKGSPARLPVSFQRCQNVIYETKNVLKITFNVILNG